MASPRKKRTINEISDLIGQKSKEIEDVEDISAPSKRLKKAIEDDNKKEVNEYEHDSSDEEDLRNTVGNIPMEWYDDYDHVGYDTEGKKILKPEKTDAIDEFLDKMENPDYWRTVIDRLTGQKVVLSDEDVQIVKNICNNKFVPSDTDPYEPWVDFFTHEVSIHPVIGAMRTKSSFLPSKWEQKKINQYVNALKRGWIVPKTDEEIEKEHKEKREMKFYSLWNEEPTQLRDYLIAPKMKLPGHAESFNPPPEYIFTQKELLHWQKHPKLRRTNFIPEKFDSIRQIPLYHNYARERFERCLDLYMCPRKVVQRTKIEPEDLLPELPKLRDLKPFPTVLSMTYYGHTNMIKTISCDPTGQWFISGSYDKTIRFWEISSGRCMKVIHFDDIVDCVAWNPNKNLSIVAVTSNTNVYLIVPNLGDICVTENTNRMIKSFVENPDADDILGIKWTEYEKNTVKYEEGFRLCISHDKPTLHLKVTWHARGDYFAVLLPKMASWSILINQLSKRRTQKPYRRNLGLIQCVQFHPTKPYIVIATQRSVRIYNLLHGFRVKKLRPSCKWISSLAVHPAGDNIICGSYDCRVNWFDLDLSTKPYRTLRKHGKAIRDVAFHRKYPLFASVSDDGSAIVCHSMVYNDLLKNPLIIPVKVLKGHRITNMLGGLACMFHPNQPWLLTSGSDGRIKLFT